MNWDKIGLLLHIADKSLKWPTLKHLHDAALKELHQMKQDREPDPLSTPEDYHFTRDPELPRESAVGGSSIPRRSLDAS